MTIPEDIKRKIKDKAIEYSKENTPQQVTLPAYHDGAFFGYSLAQSEIESKEKEIVELKDWKQSAMSVMPPMQEIGKSLGVKLGESIHDKILPEIERLKGLIEKPDYLTKISGPHFDKDGDYFVLRLDGGNTLKAAREAINVYADGIEVEYPEISKSIKERYPKI